jgi:predicted lipid-binding transport protein (Tim44 family)
VKVIRMSDLLDLIFGGALNLDPGGRWRSDPEPSPPPPGMPALPPDARAIAVGVAAIRAHDPGFDEAAMVAGARAVWHRTTGAPPAAGSGPLRAAAIAAVRAGPSLEAITVRFGTAAGEEDWVFQRSATATPPTDPVTAAGRCPGCGAPLQLDSAGGCPYCHATVLATPGWTLATRNQLRPMTGRDAEALALVAASLAPAAPAVAPPPPAAAEGVDLGPMGVDAYSLLASARATVYAVGQARSQRRPARAADLVTGELAAALRDEAAATAARHRHHVLAFLEVGDAVVTAATHAPGGDRVTVRLRLSGEEYELADATLELAEGTQTVHRWSEDWVFVRTTAAGPWLAASSVRVDDGEGPTGGR